MTESAEPEEYRTGFEQIDRQHRMIFERLDFLREAVARGEADAVIGQILTDLMEYAREHFRTEEGYFERYGYTEREGHCAEHRHFMSVVSELSAAYDEGREVKPEEVLSYLATWIDHHLKVTDKQYVPFLKDAGAT